MKPWLIDNRYERMRGCSRKVDMTAGRAHWLGRRLGQKAYHCNFCGAWHLTSRGK